MPIYDAEAEAQAAAAENELIEAWESGEVFWYRGGYSDTEEQEPEDERTCRDCGSRECDRLLVIDDDETVCERCLGQEMAHEFLELSTAQPIGDVDMKMQAYEPAIDGHPLPIRRVA